MTQRLRNQIIDARRTMDLHWLEYRLLACFSRRRDSRKPVLQHLAVIEAHADVALHRS